MILCYCWIYGPTAQRSGSHSKTNRQVMMVQNDHCRASGAMFNLRSLWVCQSRKQRRYNSLQLWLRAGSVWTSVGMRRRGAALDRQTDALAGTPHHPWDLHATAAPQPALSGSGTAPDASLAASPLHRDRTPPSLVPRVREKNHTKQTRITAQWNSVPNNPTLSPPSTH